MTLIEPNIHPILVHFTYALMTTAALCVLIDSFAPAKPWRERLAHAVDWMITFGAIAVVATIAAGFEAYYTVAHDGPSHEAMTTHRNWALPTALVLLILSGWRWKKRQERPSALFAVLFAAATISLSVTAWWGGRLVYGHGLGVSSLPEVTGEGHNHDHGDGHAMEDGHGHDDEIPADQMPHKDHHDDHHDNDTHDHGDHTH